MLLTKLIKSSIIKSKWFNAFINMINLNNQYCLKSKLNKCGENLTLYDPIFISGHECIDIGENVSINAFVHIWGQGGIHIGDRVMIASHTAITSLTHDYTKNNMFKTLIKKSIFIGDDVWIGAHSVIMPGVTIGNGAVIGAGALVTKDVEENTIVIGSPARFYKNRIIDNEVV